MAFHNVGNLNKENGFLQSQQPKIASAVVSAPHTTRRHRPHSSSSSVDAAIQHAARRQRLVPKRTFPTVDVEMTDEPMDAANTPARLRIRFPATLARPAFKDIEPDALAAIDIELATTPLPYILKKLRAAGPSMLNCVAKAQPQPSSGMPKELDVVVQDVDAECPTHMLAVWSREKHGAGPRPVELFPAHALVYAASCSLLPAFPASKPKQPESVGETLRLPVVPLCVPSRPTFGLLQHYLYTGHAERLLAMLLPKPAPGLPVEKTTQFYAQTYTPAVLTGHLMRVHGVWSNACALGIFDKDLWRVIDLAWAVLMQSLQLAGPSGVRVETVAPSQPQPQ